jgi:hypothetical protein
MKLMTQCDLTYSPSPYGTGSDALFKPLSPDAVARAKREVTVAQKRITSVSAGGRVKYRQSSHEREMTDEGCVARRWRVSWPRASGTS